MKVYINPSCDIQYASYYIYGLYQVYGRRNVIFSSEYFKKFKHNNHFLALVIKDHKGIRKVIIDFTDSKIINQLALEWCDIYGKINLESTKLSHPKIISIGPSFGIRIYSLLETVWFGLTNLIRSYSRIPNKKKFLSDYKSQYNRPKFYNYQIVASKKNYIFFMASLWKQESLTNTYRSNFIKSCKSNPQIIFEGGFAPRTKGDISGYEASTAKRRVDMQSYLDKTKQSCLVFNTPAVKDCHGWKLAEFLCLGKAIISTTLKREMPKALNNGEQLLYTNGETNDITKKVNKIILNNKLKLQLEKNAKAYFEHYLAPKQVITQLINQNC